MSNRATQAELLDQRIIENQQAQEIDLSTWIFERVELQLTDHILELCCGTGSQTQHLIRSIGAGGQVAALDISKAALDTLRGRVNGADAQKLLTIEASLDDLARALEGSKFRRPAFDLVFCAYGLYYSQDARKVLAEILSWLKPGGRIVVVGPYGPNNKALFDLVEESGVTLSEAVTFSSRRFMLEIVLPWAALHFASVRVSTMVNPVRWQSGERVLNYWQNTTFYDQSRKSAVETILGRHFAKHGEFVNKKWVMLVEMRDARR